MPSASPRAYSGYIKSTTTAARLLLLALLLALAPGCFRSSRPSPRARPARTGYRSPLYGNDAMWLCRPDLPGNPCAADLSATELRPDGSRAVEPFAAAKEPPVDCFFVYPTVDNDMRAGNHTDFSDTSPMLRPVINQAARFQEVCRL